MLCSPIVPRTGTTKLVIFNIFGQLLSFNASFSKIIGFTRKNFPRLFYDACFTTDREIFLRLLMFVIFTNSRGPAILRTSVEAFQCACSDFNVNKEFNHHVRIISIGVQMKLENWLIWQTKKHLFKYQWPNTNTNLCNPNRISESCRKKMWRVQNLRIRTSKLCVNRVCRLRSRKCRKLIYPKLTFLSAITAGIIRALVSKAQYACIALLLPCSSQSVIRDIPSSAPNLQLTFGWHQVVLKKRKILKKLYVCCKNRKKRIISPTLFGNATSSLLSRLSGKMNNSTWDSSPSSSFSAFFPCGSELRFADLTPFSPFGHRVRVNSFWPFARYIC